MKKDKVMKINKKLIQQQLPQEKKKKYFDLIIFNYLKTLKPLNLQILLINYLIFLRLDIEIFV